MSAETGHYDDGRPGPTMFVLTAVHGNEPAGVVAAGRVLRTMRTRVLPLRGRFESSIGNPEALARGVRFVKHDLNRVWGARQIAALRKRAQDAAARGDEDALEFEDAAQLALLDDYERIHEHAAGDLILVDLHSTSAHGSPFTCISDTLRSRTLARALPIPLMLGIEESIRGSTLEFAESQGLSAIVVEGGEHSDPGTADRHEAALWLLLVAAGMLDEGQVPGYARFAEMLGDAASGVPGVVDVVYRHHVDEGDGFEMNPGFRNFDIVHRGQAVAHDSGGAICVPVSGRLAMPLYQALGDDGFFLVRRVHPRWLDVSTAARRVRLGKLLRRLPGVHPHKDIEDAVVVDRRVARWWVLEAFHLAGYRRIEQDERYLTFRPRSE